MNSFPQNSFAQRRSRKAFTLLELLVVISIIAILSGISLPIYRSVTAKSVQMKCVNGLKQWGAAVQLYANDHNGLIIVHNWASIGDEGRYYEPYLGVNESGGRGRGLTVNGHPMTASEYYRWCPAQPWDYSGNAPVGYAMVRPNPKVANVGYFSMVNASHPSTTFLMIETNGSVLTINDATDWMSDFPAAVKPTCDGSKTVRHPGGANVLFADGHVGNYQWTDLNPVGSQAKRVAYWMDLGGTPP